MKFRNSLPILLWGLSVVAGSTESAMGAGPRGRVSLHRAMHQTAGPSLKPLASTEDNDEDDAPTHYPMILEIKDGGNAEKVLEELEAVVFHNRGALYLVSIPVENLDRLPRNTDIDDIQFCAPMSESLDKALPAACIDGVHQRLETLRKIEDSGLHSVVTGICDIGFDPRHEFFTNCLKRWVIYDEYHGVKAVYDGYDNITSTSPETDDYKKSHATHVAGILSGHAGGVPYYGASPSSDLVVTVSKLTEVGICGGIEDVLAYAKESGRRAVVNISAGSYLGPHDGTDLVGRYLTALADDGAVICFSAGNYGQRNNCQKFTLNIDDKPVGSGWCDMTWLGFNVSGGTDIWSSNSTPVEFRLVVWDQDSMEYKYVTEWMAGDGKEGEYYLDLEDTPWFTNGGVWCAWGTSAENGRWNAAFEYDYTSDAIKTGEVWARYAVAYQMKAVKDDTCVDVYADGIRSFLHGFTIPDCKNGNSDGSVSNLASCPDVLAVGAWNTRNSLPDVVFGERSWNCVMDNIAPWSAFGTTYDGRRLPHFAAPGNPVISAMSTPHSLSEYAGEDDTAYTAFQHGDYKYFAAAGTSMSSPMAAGVASLWLEADGRLTVHDIREIAMSTANRNFTDISDPRWGAGAIDALAGLEEIQKRLGVTDPESAMKPIVKVFAGKIEAEWPGENNPALDIRALSGVATENRDLSAGIYIVSVTSSVSGKRYVFKIKI